MSTMYERYQLIQRMRDDPAATIAGINYGHVVGSYLYDTSAIGWMKKVAFALCFGQPTTRRSGTGRKILVHYSCRPKRRADYDLIAERLSEAAGGASTYVETEARFDLRQIVRTLRSLKGAWRASRTYSGRWPLRVAIALLIGRFVSMRPQVESLLDGVDRLITFCDAQPAENLSAQVARLRGARTLTAQHGQYRLLDETNMSADAEAYANFVSDLLLSWGAATEQEFAKFGVAASRMHPVGWIRPWPTVQQEGVGLFGIMLNGENGKSANRPMLAAAAVVAEATGLEYVVRLHPANNPSEYRRLVSTHCRALQTMPAEQYFAQVEFSVAHMSGAVIEALCLGSPVYLLDEGTLADVFRVDGLSFTDVDDLLRMVLTDRSDLPAQRQRIADLARWFNDNTDQDVRIVHAVTEG